MTQVAQPAGSGTTAIRPFPKLNVPEAELTELRRRINSYSPRDEAEAAAGRG